MSETAELTIADFKPYDHVLYVPYHAAGDRSHQDCQAGLVSSVNDHYVFVRFRGVGGHLANIGQACKPDQLVKGWSRT